MDAHETQEFARLQRVEREYIELRRQWEKKTVSYGQASERVAQINAAPINVWGNPNVGAISSQIFPATSKPKSIHINRKLLLLCN